MANFNRDRRNAYYWHKQSVYTPTFSDLDKYLPKAMGSDPSQFNWKNPKPLTTCTPSVYKSDNDAQYSDKNSNLSTSKCTSTTTSSDLATVRVNVTREQRTISLSSGEALYSQGGEVTGKRPAKRRHHSTVTPGFQDEVSAKRAKRYYSTSQAINPARSLRFHPYEVEPPVFTAETVSNLLTM